MQAYVWIRLAKRLDYFGQGITGLGVGGGYAERPLGLVGAFLSHLLNGLSSSQNLARHGNDLLSDRRDLGQVFAVTAKISTQLMLEQTYLFADAQLGGKQRLRSGRNVQIMVSDFPDVSQLRITMSLALTVWV